MLERRLCGRLDARHVVSHRRHSQDADAHVVVVGGDVDFVLEVFTWRRFYDECVGDNVSHGNSCQTGVFYQQYCRCSRL